VNEHFKACIAQRLRQLVAIKVIRVELQSSAAVRETPVLCIRKVFLEVQQTLRLRLGRIDICRTDRGIQDDLFTRARDRNVESSFASAVVEWTEIVTECSSFWIRC